MPWPSSATSVDVVSPVPHDVQTVVVSNYLGLLADQTWSSRPPATTTSTVPVGTASKWPRGCADWIASRCTWTATPSTSARPGSRCAPGGTGRSPAMRWAVSWPRPRPTGRSAGSGCITHHRRVRRCATTAGVRFPTRIWPTGSSEHQPDLVFCGHIHQSPGRRRGLARPARRHLGVQRGQADRSRTGAHHRRHRRGNGGLVRRVRVRKAEPGLTAVRDRGHPRGRGRPGDRWRRLVMDELVEDLVDQAEVPAQTPANCCLTSDQVVGEAVEARSRHPEHAQRRTGVVGQEGNGILHDPEPCTAHRAAPLPSPGGPARPPSLRTPHRGARCGQTAPRPARPRLRPTPRPASGRVGFPPRSRHRRPQRRPPGGRR